MSQSQLLFKAVLLLLLLLLMVVVVVVVVDDVVVAVVADDVVVDVVVVVVVVVNPLFYHSLAVHSFYNGSVSIKKTRDEVCIIIACLLCKL